MYELLSIQTSEDRVGRYTISVSMHRYFIDLVRLRTFAVVVVLFVREIKCLFAETIIGRFPGLVYGGVAQTTAEIIRLQVIHILENLVLQKDNG